MRQKLACLRRLKMATVLEQCTTFEQRAVIRFLWAKGCAAKDIHKQMLPVYGENCVSRKSVHNWIEKFTQGRSQLADNNRTGRPVASQQKKP